MFILKILLIILWTSESLSNEVNLYTTRHYEADYDIYKQFESKTGIKINVVAGKPKPLEKRIMEEGDDCVGDLFFLADAGRLFSAQKKKLFQKITSPILNKKIPSQLRNDFWYGITKRARVIFYNPDITSPKIVRDLNYEDLANEQWKGSIAVRQSNNVYNQSLVSSLIYNNGKKATDKWLNGLVKNFYKVPSGNDRSQILAVASGDAKLAIANTYYYGLMLSGKKGNAQKEAAKKVKPIFPNQGGRGAHVNISGIGILKNAPNKKNAVKFLEFLVSEEAQKHLSENSFEFPINKSVEVPKIREIFSLDFKEDDFTPVSVLGELQRESFNMMITNKWN